MPSLLSAIVPILAALVVGFLVGRVLPSTVRAVFVRLITPLVWLLLFSIGHQFGDVLSRASGVRQVISLALLFACLTTAVPWLLIVVVNLASSGWGRPRTATAFGITTMLKPIRECAIALLAVGAGALASMLSLPHWLMSLPMPTTDQLLYFLIVLVGLDIVGITVDRPSLSARTLWIPVAVVAGSLMGGVLAAAIGGQPLSIALALSSGFGWFTLSGALVASYVGHMYGTVALLTDLFRELLAIVLLYSLGARFSHPCIGASGATALDSTLPIIKQTCKPVEIPTAMVSGLVLTLLAPFMITLFLMH